MAAESLAEPDRSAVLTEADLRDPARGSALDAHDPFAAADGLEPPTLKAGLLAGIAVGALVFIIVSMAILFGVYRVLLANAAPEPVHSFPTPRLETSINPRIMPAEPEAGPAPLKLVHPTPEPAADMARAMQAVVARGSQAYDPLPPAGAGAPALRAKP